MAKNKTLPKTAPKYNLPPTLKVSCVLQINGEPFGGKELGITTSISAHLRALRSPDKDSFLGFVIEFPLSATGENTGFGNCHHIDFTTQRAITSNTWKLTVKFPRENIDITYRAASEEENARYPASKKHMTWVDVVLGKDAQVSVQGFGMPYSNPGHPAEDWLRYPASTTVMGGLTLLDIIQQRHFSFLAARIESAMATRWSVASLAPKFDYGYGADQSWDMDRYMKQLHDVKGHRFQAAWSFETDDSHVTALTKSIVQDFMWIQKFCLDMTTEMGYAYFVKHPGSRRSKRWLVIVRMDRGIWKHRNWSQACIQGTMKLVIHPGSDELPESWTEDISERWAARVCHNLGEIRLLKRHGITENDYVIRVIEPLQIQLGIKEFESREAADAAFETDKSL
ncbi:DNA helicase [Fusarium napiforme]|uniref:DNA helicase n=1 Tax=Fusarium napiforme TaxID=42672 RepID=A0A8H5IM38_9HYPO|nr:DNA helicase [Fusarium napiforme]